MLRTFRIHGDNIVECERIAKLILEETAPTSVEISLMSPSTIVYNIYFNYLGRNFEWQLELLPGFNKAGRRRWEANIFTILKNNGSFLDETPDAIVTYVEDGLETILYAIEFCSALQAGNQAWQRSGRAFSTGRTGCPYIYVVDFVNYELNPKTRKRKSLRFPNPAVPYSYINFSEDTENFVAQVYIRSSEFDKYIEPKLRDFDENNFAEAELSRYIVKRMCGFDTSKEESIILQKNLNIVLFLASSLQPKTNFTPSQWRKLYANRQGIIEYSLKNSGFSFRKKISAKGHHGNSVDFLDLAEKLSVGMASKELPFGIIPAENRRNLANGIHKLYPTYDATVLNKIASDHSDLILCMIKGFKPKGDDNRPDRGILPLAAMLASTDIEVMTYIYGPVIERNFNALITKPEHLAASNGFWRAILALSDFVALDVPIIAGHSYDAEVLLDTSTLKEYYVEQLPDEKRLTQDEFSSIPQSFHEDDVDTGIHFLFSHLLHEVCFEGMCNPPGGDWSGLSVLYDDYEVRWLSLPRVSEEVDGKRPDHVLEIFGVFKRPVLLSIESKERSVDLEANVGEELVNYIQNLMNYVPNVERLVHPRIGTWTQSKHLVDFSAFEVISAAAYLRGYAQANRTVFERSNCDMLFIMEPVEHGWEIEIVTTTRAAKILKEFICDKIDEIGFDDITLF
ncbi:hypothetical protein [Faecalibacterium gallinarum]|uniref:Uncharacterized protein n=1 Tax=Faecalibacterium gallinarum TaxID=2903556 RepID=A0AA37J3M2_9FIRM|nr:hypothetical protein [Faecalibacterium gallinarum]GJN65691.1 hypothetical protein JCM17207_23160 [Faecalibacterium gallinarum]